MLTTDEQRAKFAQSMGQFKRDLIAAGFTPAEAAHIVVAYVRGYAGG